METKTHREEPRINWAADFTINEPLNGIASALSGVYTRMCFNFPDNPLVEYWHKQGIEWHRYYTNLYKLNFKTHEEGEVEIKRIGKICREMLELEQKLLRKSGRIDKFIGEK